MTQKEAIELHLNEVGKITSWEAFQEYGITRLSHYIYCLRREGKLITSKTVKKKNRFGGISYYSEYELKKDTAKHSPMLSGHGVPH